jgi:hypothetical protein
MEDNMRRQFLVPALVGMLALGAAQVVAQSATVVMHQNQNPNRPWMRERATSPRRSNAPANARTVVVPSNVAWTNTGLNVTRGQSLHFEPSGEIRLSYNGDDMATAAGARSFRFAEKAQIPTIPAGALIGRVGNGKPFSIGDTTQVFQMPANGRLFLGVNDDHVPDNSGNFVVRVWEP